jgi:outer membrane autotransporter protein
VNLYTEFGYKAALGDTMLEPFVNLAHIRVKTDAFSEAGGSAALSVEEGTINTTTTTLGLRAARVVALGESTTKVRGMIGWQHAFGDTATTSTARFLTGDSFTTFNTRRDKNALVVEAGMDFGLGTNATFGLSYRGRIAADARDHMANAPEGSFLRDGRPSLRCRAVSAELDGFSEKNDRRHPSFVRIASSCVEPADFMRRN